nr:protein transport inhibitor response 1-like [Tanacetum cinerariifolium]
MISIGNLRELDLPESEGEDLSGQRLSHFPDTSALSKCKELKSLSGFWDVDPYYLPVFYFVCSRLTFLNVSYANIESPNRRGITMKNKGPDGDAKTTLFNPEPAAETSISKEYLVEEESEVKVPGPRSSLYELCKKMQWPMSTFTTSERKSN